jgi:DNA-binding HxlR family transcriptional regulator
MSLKELEKDGIVTRTVHAQVPPKVEYALSEMGITVGPSMAELIDWVLMRSERSAS